MSLRHFVDTGYQARVGHALQTLVARPAAPDAHLVLALDRALEVDAPGIAVRVEVVRPERELDFERPSRFVPV